MSTAEKPNFDYRALEKIGSHHKESLTIFLGTACFTASYTALHFRDYKFLETAHMDFTNGIYKSAWWPPNYWEREKTSPCRPHVLCLMPFLDVTFSFRFDVTSIFDEIIL